MYVTRRNLGCVGCGRDNKLGAPAGTEAAPVIMTPIKLVPEAPTLEPEPLPETASESNGMMYAGGSSTFDEAAGAVHLPATGTSTIAPMSATDLHKLSTQLATSKSGNPEMEFHSTLFNLPPEQIAEVRRQVLAHKQAALRGGVYYSGPGGTYTKPSVTDIAPTKSEQRMAAEREAALRTAMFQSETAHYDPYRKFQASEEQAQEMAERRGEASANQVTVTDDGFDYAGQAVAPPGGVGVPRPDAGAPGGAAALIPLGILAYLFLA